MPEVPLQKSLWTILVAEENGLKDRPAFVPGIDIDTMPMQDAEKAWVDTASIAEMPDSTLPR